MADQSQNAEVQRRQAEAWKNISTYHSVCTMYKPDDPRYLQNVKLLIDAISREKKKVSDFIDTIPE